MDACRGHSSEALIGSHHFFFQEKTSFPNSPPVEYFGFSLRKWKCSYSNLGNSSFPQIKKKREFFSQIFVIYVTSTVGKLGFSEARAYRPVTASIIRFARLELDDGSTEKCIESISTR